MTATPDAGDRVRVQKGVGDDESIYSPDSKIWIVFSVAAAGCLGYVVWFVRGRWLHARWRRQQ